MPSRHHHVLPTLLSLLPVLLQEILQGFLYQFVDIAVLIQREVLHVKHEGAVETEAVGFARVFALQLCYARHCTDRQRASQR